MLIPLVLSAIEGGRGGRVSSPDCRDVGLFPSGAVGSWLIAGRGGADGGDSTAFRCFACSSS